MTRTVTAITRELEELENDLRSTDNENEIILLERDIESRHRELEELNSWEESL